MRFLTSQFRSIPHLLWRVFENLFLGLRLRLAPSTKGKDTGKQPVGAEKGKHPVHKQGTNHPVPGGKDEGGSSGTKNFNATQLCATSCVSMLSEVLQKEHAFRLARILKEERNLKAARLTSGPLEQETPLCASHVLGIESAPEYVDYVGQPFSCELEGLTGVNAKFFSPGSTSVSSDDNLDPLRSKEFAHFLLQGDYSKSQCIENENISSNNLDCDTLEECDKPVLEDIGWSDVESFLSHGSGSPTSDGCRLHSSTTDISEDATSP
jgi:hypothetical protein